MWCRFWIQSSPKEKDLGHGVKAMLSLEFKPWDILQQSKQGDNVLGSICLSAPPVCLSVCLSALSHMNGLTHTWTVWLMTLFNPHPVLRGSHRRISSLYLNGKWTTKVLWHNPHKDQVLLSHIRLSPQGPCEPRKTGLGCNFFTTVWGLICWPPGRKEWTTLILIPQGFSGYRL